MLAIPTAVYSVFIGFATLLQGANVGPRTRHHGPAQRLHRNAAAGCLTPMCW
jgi:hypothetical protein